MVNDVEHRNVNLFFLIRKPGDSWIFPDPLPIFRWCLSALCLDVSLPLSLWSELFQRLAMVEAEATATATQQGSWIPLLLIVSLIFLRWLCYTDGATPIRIRRWYNMQVRVRYVCCACAMYVAHACTLRTAI
jgi:hypothetical protein